MTEKQLEKLEQLLKEHNICPQCNGALDLGWGCEAQGNECQLCRWTSLLGSLQNAVLRERRLFMRKFFPDYVCPHCQQQRLPDLRGWFITSIDPPEVVCMWCNHDDLGVFMHDAIKMKTFGDNKRSIGHLSDGAKLTRQLKRMLFMTNGLPKVKDMLVKALKHRLETEDLSERIARGIRKEIREL